MGRNTLDGSAQMSETAFKTGQGCLRAKNGIGAMDNAQCGMVLDARTAEQRYTHRN